MAQVCLTSLYQCNKTTDQYFGLKMARAETNCNIKKWSLFFKLLPCALKYYGLLPLQEFTWFLGLAVFGVFVSK